MNLIKFAYTFFSLESNTFKSAKKIKHIQEKRLRRLLLYAYDYSKYYKELYDKSGITREDLKTISISKLPSIDKNVFMKNFDDILTTKEITQQDLREFDREKTLDDKSLNNKYHIVHSSGSTGKPCYFVYDENAWNTLLIGIIRGALWEMSKKDIFKLIKKHPKILYVAATDGRYAGAMSIYDGVTNLKASFESIDINSSLDSWIEKINNYKPDILIGYPSALKIIGESKNRGEINIDITRAISCGEPLGSNLREFLENTFHSPVINFYGASESIAMGVEVNNNDGMYLFDDLNYIEIEEDEIYLTNLYNFTQPIIRYKLTDNLVINKEDTTFTNVSSIVGRNEDILWFKNKNGAYEFLHPLAIEGFCVEGMLDYQFVQISSNDLKMIIELTDEKHKNNIKKEMKNNMKKIFKINNIDNINFSIDFVEDILPDAKTGKKKLVVKMGE